MRKRIAAVLVAAALAGGINAGFAVADPGPHHGNNQKGLCQAAKSGNKTGWEKKGAVPPPFADFDTEADGVITEDEWNDACNTEG